MKIARFEDVNGQFVNGIIHEVVGIGVQASHVIREP
jgi:hypothetical protein